MAKDDDGNADDDLSIDEIDKWISQLVNSGDENNLLLQLDETLFEGELPEPPPLNNDAQLTDEEFCETFFQDRVLKWFKTLQPSTVARYKAYLSEFILFRRDTEHIDLEDLILTCI
jgi:hypothetical protein